jgi:hypothetical protein
MAWACGPGRPIASPAGTSSSRPPPWRNCSLREPNRARVTYEIAELWDVKPGGSSG